MTFASSQQPYPKNSRSNSIDPSDAGLTPLWTRVNSLASPWALDDITTLVGGIGDRLAVMMIPKVEGPWGIHYVDRLLAQIEAKPHLEREAVRVLSAGILRSAERYA